AQMLWPNLAQATLLERDARMIALGQRLASEATSPVIRQARWERTDITDAWESGHQSFDLVTASYVLGELPAPERETLVARLWRVTVSMLALVAPGTPVGFAHIHAAREQLLELGATLVAPCPHDGACPMLPLGEGEVAPGQPVGDWCHFSQRLARSRLHRQLKGGELAYEDEKFSYVIAARPGSEAAPATSIGGRIVRHPQMRPGVVTLEVCARDGALTRRVVSRRDGAAYRQARDLRWGDALRS
ncbi:MAG TPA: small ribosomal subunit Rsm22 family protein, partial [Ktedonobacterales bacterium]|nr:small ribosomal subunit Rsm22 family protein [Ktedonobacterales bacterium]